jgi:hypothetical protein
MSTRSLGLMGCGNQLRPTTAAQSPARSSGAQMANRDAYASVCICATRQLPRSLVTHWRLVSKQFAVR